MDIQCTHPSRPRITNKQHHIAVDTFADLANADDVRCCVCIFRIDWPINQLINVHYSDSQFMCRMSEQWTRTGTNQFALFGVTTRERSCLRRANDAKQIDFDSIRLHWNAVVITAGPWTLNDSPIQWTTSTIQCCPVALQCIHWLVESSHNETDRKLNRIRKRECANVDSTFMSFHQRVSPRNWLSLRLSWMNFAGNSDNSFWFVKRLMFRMQNWFHLLNPKNSNDSAVVCLL